MSSEKEDEEVPVRGEETARRKGGSQPRPQLVGQGISDDLPDDLTVIQFFDLGPSLGAESALDKGAEEVATLNPLDVSVSLVEPVLDLNLFVVLPGRDEVSADGDDVLKCGLGEE